MINQKLVLWCLLVFLAEGFAVEGWAASGWQRPLYGINETEVTAIAVDPLDPKHVLAGTARRVYESFDGGASFRALAELPYITDILFSLAEPDKIFVATRQGVYAGTGAGRHWQRLFVPSGDSRCLVLAEGQDGRYLGTTRGLYFQPRAGSAWRKINGILQDRAVFDLRVSGPDIFILTAAAVLRFTEPDKSFHEVLAWPVAGAEDAPEEEEDSEDLPPAALAARGAAVMVIDESVARVSFDRGNSWLTPPGIVPVVPEIRNFVITFGAGCESTEINCLRIWAGTARGAHYFDGTRWHSVYAGMDARLVHEITAGDDGALRAATDRGFFYWPDGQALASGMGTRVVPPAVPATDVPPAGAVPGFDHEPDIRQVHSWAIDYGEVSHQKIETWRRQAKQRALVPSLRFGASGGHAITISDTIYGSSSSGGTHYIAPDDKSFRRDVGWTATVGWDLADWVWSSAQTSIDARSKLMVELREDILDQVTRLYFERRRLQMDLGVYGAGDDARAAMEKTLRIDELTALIDGFTGGRFGRALEGEGGGAKAGNGS
jgi:hypothetical protein